MRIELAMPISRRIKYDFHVKLVCRLKYTVRSPSCPIINTGVTIAKVSEYCPTADAPSPTRAKSQTKNHWDSAQPRVPPAKMYRSIARVLTGLRSTESVI